MNHKLQAKSFELWATTQAISYVLRATSFETQVTSYELRSVTCKNSPAPADESTVQYLAVEWLYGAESMYRKIISRYELDF